MHIIQSDPRGKFVPFISDSSDYVELGLEKPLLENPLKVEASLQLYAGVADQYTGSGEAVTATAPISLDLLAVLKTLHAISISPSVMTLDEDNTYTTFCAVEANDDADWTLEPVDPRLTVSPTSGTGRASVVVKTDSLFEPTMNFENVPLTVVSMVDDELYPDIEGDYIVDDTAEVHVEQYTPQHNALIPKMLSNTSGERDGVLTSGVTLTSAQSDPAGELNADLTGTVRAVFAITSEEDVLERIRN